MTRTLLLGAVGLVLAVVVGLGVHALTRDTTSLPVVRLEAPPPAPATTAPTTRDATTEVATTAEQATTAHPAIPPPPTEVETETEVETGEDSSGRGRGRNRGRGGDD